MLNFHALSKAPRTSGGPTRPRGFDSPSCPGEEEREKCKQAFVQRGTDYRFMHSSTLWWFYSRLCVPRSCWTFLHEPPASTGGHAGGHVCATSTFWFGHVNYLPGNAALLQESFAVRSQTLAVMTVERSTEGGRQIQVMAH